MADSSKLDLGNYPYIVDDFYVRFPSGSAVFPNPYRHDGLLALLENANNQPDGQPFGRIYLNVRDENSNSP